MPRCTRRARIPSGRRGCWRSGGARRASPPLAHTRPLVAAGSPRSQGVKSLGTRAQERPPSALALRLAFLALGRSASAPRGGSPSCSVSSIARALSLPAPKLRLLRHQTRGRILSPAFPGTHRLPRPRALPRRDTCPTFSERRPDRPRPRCHPNGVGAGGARSPGFRRAVDLKPRSSEDVRDVCKPVSVETRLLPSEDARRVMDGGLMAGGEIKQTGGGAVLRPDPGSSTRRRSRREH